MPHRFCYWVPRAERKIAEHGVTKAEVEHVLTFPDADEPSRSNPANIWAAGYTTTGRYIAVVYQPVDDQGVWVAPITAYEISEE